MSAQIIWLADYRKAKPKKKHGPKCRACRRPGHYHTTCDDHAALARFEEARRKELAARIESIRASFGGRVDDREFLEAMREIYPERAHHFEGSAES